MTSAARDQAVMEARSVASAAAALTRALRNDPDDVMDAAEQLELQGTLAVEASSSGFDTGDSEASDEDRLAASVSSFGIGLTLVAAEASATDGNPDYLAHAVDSLERNTDELEAGGVEAPGPDHFDTQPGGTPLTPHAAAMAALDEMVSSAANVATSILDNAMKPLVSKLPEAVTDVLSQLQLNIGGRLASLGLRAVRRGIDLLLTIVDLNAINTARARIDDLLTRLGQGQDAAVLTGWVIGADEVRGIAARAAARPEVPGDQDLVQEIARLAERYSQLCTSLRRIAVALVGLAGMLALLHVTLPNSVAVTTIGLALVLGAAIVMGRDYTGATDLPGRVRGVRLVMAPIYGEF